MSDREELWTSQFTTSLAGLDVDCHATLYRGWILRIVFVYAGYQYVIEPAASGYRFVQMLRQYLREAPDSEFADGTAELDIHTISEKQGEFGHMLARHTMQCLNALLLARGPYLQDYAKWYLENCANRDIYASLVQHAVCLFIVESKLLCHTSEYAVVEWRPRKQAN
jgi:hypothetical protein